MKQKVSSVVLKVMLVWLFVVIVMLACYNSVPSMEIFGVEIQGGFILGALLTGVIISLFSIIMLSLSKKESDELSNARKNYAAVGLGLAAFGMLVMTSQSCYANVMVEIFGMKVLYEPWFSWLQVIIPTYGIGFLAYVLLCRRAHKTPVERHKMTIGQFICCVFMNAGIAAVGAIIGAVVNMFMPAPYSGADAGSLAELMLNSDDFWRVLTVGICAPIFEELIFRKLLIDRVHKYGEGIAILTSGLLFGLFHGNFSQVFFATGLGLFFAFIYIRTGKVWYTIAFHMIVNLATSVISVKLISGLDFEVLDKITYMDPVSAEAQALVMEILPSLLLVTGWLLVLGIFALVGIILWIIKARKFYLIKGPESVEKKKIRTVFGNFGMLYFLLLCAFLFVQNYIPYFGGY